MGFATHLGPWLLGTVRNTTGTTVGTIENCGATVVSQTFKKNYTGTTTAGTSDTICVLPAGAQIINLYQDTLVAFTGSTAANAQIGDGTTVNKYFTTTDLTTAGRAASTNGVLANWAGAASTASPNGIGIGPVDVKVVATMTPTVATVTAGTVQYTVVYVVADSSGAQFPASA
jgi:hypothetical protein